MSYHLLFLLLFLLFITFLPKVIYARLGSIIQGQADTKDSRTFFTESYVAQHTARIRGALSALTRYIFMSYESFCIIPWIEFTIQIRKY